MLVETWDVLHSAVGYAAGQAPAQLPHYVLHLALVLHLGRERWGDDERTGGNVATIITAIIMLISIVTDPTCASTPSGTTSKMSSFLIFSLSLLLRRTALETALNNDAGDVGTT